MKLKLAAALLGTAWCVASPLAATTWDYDFTACPGGHSCPGSLGTSQAYTSGGFPITAYGFEGTKKHGYTPDDLYVKLSGADESGLGLADESDREIVPGTFIQLDLTSLAAAGIDSGWLSLGSVQSGEGFTICVSASIGSLGLSCFKGNQNLTPFPVAWTASSPILGITATKGNVLVRELAVTSSTPEPGTLVLLGGALLVAALLSRRFRSAFTAG